MRRHPEAYRFLRRVFVGGLLIASAGCGRKHYLGEYRFENRTLALSFVEPPSPQLLTGYYNLRPSTDPIVTATRAAGGVAKEIEARRAMARLDSASRLVDVPRLLAQRTLERTAMYLGAQPVQSVAQADFVIEINMRRFGIDARSNQATYLFTRAEAVLLDRRTGREIWSTDIHGSDQLTPWFAGTNNIPSSVITAATTHTVSVPQLQDALQQLVTSSSNAITRELRDKLYEAREKAR